MHEETSFVSLLIVVALAAIVPVFTTQIRKARIPVVVVGGHTGALALAERLAKFNDTVILVVPSGSPSLSPARVDLQVVQVSEITQDALRAAGSGQGQDVGGALRA